MRQYCTNAFMDEKAPFEFEKGVVINLRDYKNNKGLRV
jgi:hypothetical protein